MYKVLYRAYRPEVFREMLGQEHIVRILENQLAAGTVNHAYLFCGTRGTGKTTAARLLAKGVNCTAAGTRPCGECENCKRIAAGNFMDLIEIDAASNNGIDNIRELRESVNYPPVEGRMKVYIIDEVHMLSTPAFNALLKTLEEPPESVIFILCTTEPEKLPATILSRCMRMDFRRVPEEQILERVFAICRDNGVEIEESAARLIVASADGSARDCLTILDQCISGRSGTLSRDDCLDALGAVGEEVYSELTEFVNDHDPAGGLLVIDRLIKDGRDARQILSGWMNHYRNLLMAKFVRDPESVLSMSVENIDRIMGQAMRTDVEMINTAIVEIAKTINETKQSNQPRVLLEICMVRLAASGGARLKMRPTPDFDGPKDGNIQDAQHPIEANDQRDLAGAGNGSGYEKPERTAEYNADDAVYQTPGTQGGEQAQPKGEHTPSADESPLSQTCQEYGREDLEEIWAEICEDGESMSETFRIVSTSCVPLKMNADEFVIMATPMGRMYLEKNERPMKALLEKHLGHPVEMIIVAEKGEETKDSIEDTAKKASEILGTEVTIKDN